MKSQPSIFRDFFHLLFASRRFFSQRFSELSAQRIFGLSFIGVFAGALIGSLLTLSFSHYVLHDFMRDQTPYMAILTSLGLDAKSFPELLKEQQAYSLIVAFLSPVLAYGAPHLFGGALYLFLWLLYRPSQQFEMPRVLECSAIGLVAMTFQIIPGIGPIFALIYVAVNTSRALAVQYKLVGFLKVMSIVSAMYLCSFLGSATLQMLAKPFATYIEWR